MDDCVTRVVHILRVEVREASGKMDTVMRAFSAFFVSKELQSNWSCSASND